jgi:hypothetical protein
MPESGQDTKFETQHTQPPALQAIQQSSERKNNMLAAWMPSKTADMLGRHISLFPGLVYGLDEFSVYTCRESMPTLLNLGTE